MERLPVEGDALLTVRQMGRLEEVKVKLSAARVGGYVRVGEK